MTLFGPGTPHSVPDDAQVLINRMEALIHQDIGRGMTGVFRATLGGLWDAISAFAASAAPKVGLITGFFVPRGDPPAAETDGPAGAALLARGFLRAGMSCRLATDTVCRRTCRVALDTAGAGTVPVDAAIPGGPVHALVDEWRRDGIEWVIAIERCGPAADGQIRNMRGADITRYAAPLDQLFTAGPWRTIAIGDGGNELGMGRLARSLASEHVPLGDAIACVVPADFLITAGVSHWGAYAILAALATLRPDWHAALRAALDPALDRTVIEAMVHDGPAVDGVSLRREATIDGLAMTVHREVMEALAGLIVSAA